MYLAYLYVSRSLNETKKITIIVFFSPLSEDFHKSSHNAFDPIKKAFGNIRVFEAINKCSPMPLDLHLTSKPHSEFIKN